MEAFGDAFGKRKSLVTAQSDQPLAFVDAVGAGIAAVVAHPPLSAAMLAA